MEQETQIVIGSPSILDSLERQKDMDQEIPSKGNQRVKRIRIGLLGPYGVGNLGDAAIQQAMIYHIRRRMTNAQIVGISLNPSDTRSRHGIPTVSITRTGMEWYSKWESKRESPVSRINGALKSIERVFLRVLSEIGSWISVFRLLGKFRLLVISGGGQLDDYWGGSLGHPYTLFKWSLAARMRNVKTAFVSVGAGPLDSWLSRLLVKMALSMAAYRSYRDEYSRLFVQGIGVNRLDPVYPDLAHSLPVPLGQFNRKPSGGPMVIGVSPMAYLDSRIWPEKNETAFKAYLEKMAGVVLWLLARGHNVAMFPSEFRHDQPVIDDLMKLIEQANPDGKTRIRQRPVLTVGDLLEEMRSTDIIIASRLHAVLLAHTVGRPVLAVSYHPKIDALMNDMGHSGYCYDIDRFTINDLADGFRQMTQQRAALIAQINRKESDYQQRLDKQYETFMGFFGNERQWDGPVSSPEGPN